MKKLGLYGWSFLHVDGLMWFFSFCKLDTKKFPRKLAWSCTYKNVHSQEISPSSCNFFLFRIRLKIFSLFCIFIRNATKVFFLQSCWKYVNLCFKQVMWTFSIYLEAVAILPQLVLLQRTRNVDNLTGQYVFLLG